MNESQENILDNYTNPRNFGTPKFQFNSSAKLQNLSCGDEIEVYIQIDNNKLTDISFIGEGCSIAIGTASILYSALKGRQLKAIKKLTIEKVEKLIGIPLTISRKKCALLSLKTLQKAIEQAKLS